MQTKCIICGGECEQWPAQGQSAFDIRCSKCGNYLISHQAHRGTGWKDQVNLSELSSALKKFSDHENPEMVDASNAATIIFNASRIGRSDFRVIHNQHRIATVTVVPWGKNFTKKHAMAIPIDRDTSDQSLLHLRDHTTGEYDATKSDMEIVRELLAEASIDPDKCIIQEAK